MRTKTLLIAAAALAATVISSEAQTVYSANIVGYVNVVCPAGVNEFVATPLTTGNDVLTNVLTGASANTAVEVWNPTAGSFALYTFSGPVSNRHWKDASGNNADNILVGPGAAYFVEGGGNGFTNSFVGQVAVASGASSTNSLAAGVEAALGSEIAYGGYVTNTAALNLVPPANTTLELWDPTNQVFNAYNYSGPVSNRTWKDVNNNVAYPQINVGQGFFLDPGAAYNWVQTLPQ